ncbi:hypothetical protein FGG08_002784 [Glutinoglossum americanum]|uniref:Uncharacterized protein n=1 Tax=Glutinoglossum americanum TaxID=1670608 RepID=A0A9P8L472_9PEZI|nr:hypothetical protein FGG08_002784 [Glutinoglossum americanum]
MATVAFDVVRKTPLLQKHVRVEIYRPLLEWNISKSSLSQALLDSFKGDHPDISFLQLLLAKDADPNKDNGHCFAVASKAGAFAEFRALSKAAGGSESASEQFSKGMGNPFGCLPDKTRIPILKALLDLDRDRISDYVIPGSSFGPLGVYPKVFKTDSDLLDAAVELPLREASLYLGNFEAFRLITREMTPNDGTLHLAALMALPKLVKALLKIHDPDHKTEELPTKNRTGRPGRETIQLLAPRTSPKWRYRNMTILRWAMDNGLDTAKAMIEALDIRHDPERDEKYLYMDRDGIEYSPQQYVMKVWDADKKEEKALNRKP